MLYPSVNFMTRQGQPVPLGFNRFLPFMTLGYFGKSMIFNAYTLCEVRHDITGWFLPRFSLKKPVAPMAFRSMLPDGIFSVWKDAGKFLPTASNTSPFSLNLRLFDTFRAWIFKSTGTYVTPVLVTPRSQKNSHLKPLQSFLRKAYRRFHPLQNLFRGKHFFSGVQNEPA